MQPAFGLPRIGGRMAVQQFHIVAERLEAVGTALWDEQGRTIVGGQNFRVPTQERGRSMAQVHRHIPDLPTHATYEFHLGVRWMLEV